MAYRGLEGAVVDRPVGKDWAGWGVAPSIVPAARVSSKAAARAPDVASRGPLRPILPRCPEIDCIRHRLPAGVLALAELRAAEIGVGADRVLVAQGLIEEETYLNALAHWLGIAFEPLDQRPREACPLADDNLIDAVNVGLLPLAVEGELHLVIAPRELTVRRLLGALRPGSDLAKRVRITSGERMTRFATQHAKQTIGYRAAEALRDGHPELSAGTGRGRSVATAILVAGIALFALVAPGVAAIAVEVMLGLIFLAWTGLRLLGTLSPRSVRRTPKPVSDDRLPIYTIVIALYREAAAAKDLVAALRSLNYPGTR